jgi:serine/threonine-protein kinase RsbW
MISKRSGVGTMMFRLAWRLTFEKIPCYYTVMPPEVRKSFELTIPSRLDAMNSVYALVATAIQEFKIDEELAHWIELTVSESVINAIQHGNKCDPAKNASLKISSDGSALEVIVEDQGCGFALSDVADPTNCANILKPTGRGILIIRSFMDEVVLTQLEGGGTRLRMVKKLPRGSVL